MSLLLPWVSCKGESTTGSSASVAQLSSGNNSPPIIKSAKLISDPISLAGPVIVQVDAEDPEREAVSFQYQWYLNDAQLTGQTHATLSPELLRRGDRVSVEITPLDTNGQKGFAQRTSVVSVGNTAPIVTRASLAADSHAGDRLEVQVEAHDPDHDQVDLTYRWLRNNVQVKNGEEPFLDTKGFVSRDVITVEVTGHDPSGPGKSLKSDSLILGNSLPKIVSVPPSTKMFDHYEYTVKGVDSDGDLLTYNLEAAPLGMTIEAQTGQILWQIPAGQSGTHHVRVVATDGQGGSAFQEFDINLSPSLPGA